MVQPENRSEAQESHFQFAEKRGEKRRNDLPKIQSTREEVTDVIRQNARMYDLELRKQAIKLCSIPEENQITERLVGAL